VQHPTHFREVSKPIQNQKGLLLKHFQVKYVRRTKTDFSVDQKNNNSMFSSSTYRGAHENKAIYKQTRRFYLMST
jgi:hypothetical protein